MPTEAPILNRLSQLSSLLVHLLRPGNKPASFLSQKGDESNPLNYRHIAITSLISKIMETLVTKQLLTFIETNNLLSDHPQGFQKARSIGDLAYAVNVWSLALESYGENRVTSLDIFNAFDHVWHKGFLAKLPMFRLHHTIIKWIGSFLFDRSTFIRVDGFLSNPYSVSSTIPTSPNLANLFPIVI